MTVEEVMEFLALLRQLSEEKQKELLYMLKGASWASSKEMI